MTTTDTDMTEKNAAGWMNDAVSYGTDLLQRSAIYMNILRKRGNTYLEHNREGMPPVLSFDYDILLDGRQLEPATNYKLARIRDRRKNGDGAENTPTENRRLKIKPTGEPETVPPVVILDPRAGGGPGIGGIKQDSEIGMALSQGHPVYFILFTPDPVPGQTMPDVQKTLAQFIETVTKLHSQAGKPVIIGNCQAGWAVAMLGALKPEKVGPIILNGAPLSFWAGVTGKNPMRYRGGWTGGAWLTSLWSDLGNGVFDGANLMAGFEDLNLARTLWDKQYALWAQIDSEEERYLEFERWWNGFFKLTGEEIHFIVDELFVGNRLEKGKVHMNGRPIDLKRLQGPVFVFASQGDNITPPQQALNWIPEVWGTVDEIRRQKRVIVYMVHETIGHLGIFVSGPVSRKEHKEMIGSIGHAELLAPGLYEMAIREKGEQGEHDVRFIARDMADILALDDDEDDEAHFTPVASLSTATDLIYRLFMRPFVQLTANEESAEVIRQLHPLRVSKYMFSDLNPVMALFKPLAGEAKNNRRPTAPDNPFSIMEKQVSNTISASLDLVRDVRDLSQELWFQSVYGNPWLQFWFNDRQTDTPGKNNTCRAEWLEEVNRGGFTEGVVRIMTALAYAGGETDRRVLKGFREVSEKDERLTRLVSKELTETVQKQACILVHAPDQAIASLKKLIPDPDDRRTALSIARGIFPESIALQPEVQAHLETIQEILEIYV